MTVSKLRINVIQMNNFTDRILDVISNENDLTLQEIVGVLEVLKCDLIARADTYSKEYSED